jgi:hypothetical protein
VWTDNIKTNLKETGHSVKLLTGLNRRGVGASDTVITLGPLRAIPLHVPSLSMSGLSDFL